MDGFLDEVFSSPFLVPTATAKVTAASPTTPGISMYPLFYHYYFFGNYSCSLYFYYNLLLVTIVDPCLTEGCNAPYNLGCRVVNNTAECICPACPNTRRPVCASDDVQDLSECHLRQQACLGNISITVDKQGPCGKFALFLLFERNDK